MVDSNLLWSYPFQSCLKNLYFFGTSKTPFEFSCLLVGSLYVSDSRAAITSQHNMSNPADRSKQSDLMNKGGKFLKKL